MTKCKEKVFWQICTDMMVWCGWKKSPMGFWPIWALRLVISKNFQMNIYHYFPLFHFNFFKFNNKNIFFLVPDPLRLLVMMLLEHTTLQFMMNTKLSKQRFWHCYENRLIKIIQKIPHNLYVSVKLTSLYCGLRSILVYPNPL